MIESSLNLGSFESSEDEDTSKDRKAGNQPRRFEPPRIPLTKLHEGQIELRPAEAKPVLPAPLLESLVRGKQEADKGSAEKEAQHVSLEAPSTSLPEITQTTPFEPLPDHAKAEAATGENEEDEDDEEDAGNAAPVAGQHKISIDWPHATPDSPAKEAAAPEHPAEFEEVLQQLGEEYAEAASDSTPGSPVEGEIPAGFRAGEDDPGVLRHDDEPLFAKTPPSAGGTTPPRPPIVPPTESGGGSFDDPPEPDPGAGPKKYYAYNTSPPPPPWAVGGNVMPNASPSAAFGAFEQSGGINSAERRALRRGLIAGFLTGYVLKAYLANRKLKRFQAASKQQFAQANERFAALQSQHNQLQEKTTSQAEQFQRQQREQQERFDRFKANQPAPARFETAAPTANMPPLPKIEAPSQQLPPVEALPQVQAQAEEQWVDERGNEIPLQPGQRLERRGWYSVVIDEHGREVPGAIHYGEAFQREQKREQLSDAAQDQDDDATKAKTASDAPAAGSYTALPGFGISSVSAPLLNDTAIASGQADPAHSLPPGQPTTVNPQHRLPQPRNQFVAAVTSPWLWLAVAVLLIAYFTAALV